METDSLRPTFGGAYVPWQQLHHFSNRDIEIRLEEQACHPASCWCLSNEALQQKPHQLRWARTWTISLQGGQGSLWPLKILRFRAAGTWAQDCTGVRCSLVTEMWQERWWSVVVRDGVQSWRLEASGGTQVCILRMHRMVHHWWYRRVDSLTSLNSCRMQRFMGTLVLQCPFP